MFMLRAISRKPIPEARAVLICSQRSEEILLRNGRFASGSWLAVLRVAHVQMNGYAGLGRKQAKLR
jgi:hypothetical protein